ncbi:DUF1307 domain-containing protein [Gracilibacillus sp. S3-1-1]|uniref:DUF1307 domain-containing protein n=1 Tax=Gracilibacillus pellucidus TaxID=3095368 RepID=A0ACC6M734_9BACI|nr:DUF1307 domain-containing protein [Gracilibacillus sp. S3-1-1]MDX8046779.1 DUF1307 domain-containing protein [Gracilibacillus sp. S3-1-1]
MKKIMMLCLVLLFSIALVACNSSDANKSEGKESNDKDVTKTTEQVEGNVEEENLEEGSEALETQAFEFDPSGENIVPLELTDEGLMVRLTYKGIGDLVTEQTTESIVKYDSMGLSNAEEAQEALEELTEEYTGIEGVSYNVDFQDDQFVESLSINYEIADPSVLTELTGAFVEGDLSNGVSLQDSVRMFQAQGFEIVEE